MRLVALKIEPHLVEAFMGYLYSHNYQIQKSNSPTQGYWVNHSTTPEISHITKVDHWGNLIVPERLYDVAMRFLCNGNTKCI